MGSQKQKSKRGFLGFKSTKILCKKKVPPQKEPEKELPPLPPVPKVAPVVKPIADYHPSLDPETGIANLGRLNNPFILF